MSSTQGICVWLIPGQVMPDRMDPFAITGISFRMPQDAVDEDSFWDVLMDRRNLMTEWPKGRANIDSFYEGPLECKQNKLHARGAHFINEDLGGFDAPFFSISPKEAAAIDPQHRWALEAAYHAVENAGIAMDTLQGSLTAVYGSSFADDYARMTMKDPDMAAPQTGTGVASSILPNRVSWFFDLHGPSVYIDTACSSSLVALDMACQAMRNGNATAAIIIGSNLILNPELSTLLDGLGFLSPDSQCRAFDSCANGYARGEGVIALFVKPLSEALRNGDVIRAVIRGTGSNQDGRTTGLTQPSVKAQESLIRHVYESSGLSFDDTGYVEAHGTGTAVGDPIEMEAIGRVFGPSRSAEKPLYVGSVKSNVGHLEAASGLAGVVKSILVLEKGIIPPSALFNELNPTIKAQGHHIEVPAKSLPWPRSGLRRISVNSFGFGGTNAHVILDDALHYLEKYRLRGRHHSLTTPAQANGTTHILDIFDKSSYAKGNSNKLGTHSRPMLLVFSAADASATHRMVQNYSAYYSKHVVGLNGKLEQFALTLASRRSLMPWRTFAIAGPIVDLKVNGNGTQPGLDTPQSLRAVIPIRSSGGNPAAAFIFTGQGAQYSKMGLDLMQYSVFEQSFKKSDEILSSLGFQTSIIDELRSEERIHDPEVSQPLCTTLQIALVELLRSFGVVPAAVLGHSSGEIAAAFAIGALSHEAACKVAYYRGKVTGDHRRASGSSTEAMMSVNIPGPQVPAMLRHLGLAGNSIHVACVNSPKNITLSGQNDAIDTLKKHLDVQGIFAYKLQTGVAYHSPAMRDLSGDYSHLMGSLETGRAPSQPIVMISTVTGELVAPKTLAKPQYWVENLLSPVRFADAIRCLQDGMSTLPLPVGTKSITDLIEIGPHSALKRSVLDSVSLLRYQTVLERNTPASESILRLVGALFCHGYSVSVLAANKQDPDSTPPLVDCPPYPFDHSKSYWSESRISKGYRFRDFSPGYLIGKRVYDWNPLVPRWRNWMCTGSIPWLGDHIINGTALCPGSGMLVMAIEAARQAAGPRKRQISGILFQDAQFIAPIVVGETLEMAAETVVELRPVTRNADQKGSTASEVHIFSCLQGKWSECFRTKLQIQYEETSDIQFNGPDEYHLEEERVFKMVEAASDSCAHPIDSPTFYRFLERHGFGHCASFQLLRSIRWDGDWTSCAKIDMSSASRLYQAEADSPVHPAVLDAAVQLLVAQASRGLGKDLATIIPKRLLSGWFSSKIWERSASVHLCSVEHAGDNLVSGIDGSLYAVADDGSALCSIEHLHLAEVSAAVAAESHGPDQMMLYRIAWKPCLSSMSAEELRNFFVATIELDDTALREFLPKMEIAMLAAARKAVGTITETDLAGGPGYLRKYVASMEHQLQRFPAPESLDLSDSELELLLQQCEVERPDWRIFPMVARALPSILRCQTDPLDLLFSTNALEDLYAPSFKRQADVGLLRRFLDLASHENPGLRILEVGAGTGAMSRLVIHALRSFERETSQVRFSEYIYTDISAGFFEKARSTFTETQNRVHFKVFDLELDPLEQGFEPASYDVIVAGSVLHVCADLTVALQKLRALLKPGGLLVFLEIPKPESICANIGFGLLEGWWSANEKWRQYSPLATQERWDELLRRTGFSGVDVAFRDSDNHDCLLTSIMVSRAVQQSGSSRDHKGRQVILIVDRRSNFQYVLAGKIQQFYHQAEVLELADVEATHANPSALIISLVEVDRALLANLSASDFDQLRTHVVNVQDMLWITSSTDGKPFEPHRGLATGFLRTIRAEYENKHIVTLAIESCSRGHEDRFITEVLQCCFENNPRSCELEFVVSDDILMIGRLEQNKMLDEKRISHTHPRMMSQAWGSSPPLALEFGTPGMLDTLRFTEDSKDDIAPNDVEIQADVWPVSFRDVFIALGRLGKEPLGYECAGIVTRVGGSADLTPGDRVLMLAPGCMRSHPRAPADSVFKIPDNLTFNDAVAGMNPGMTAFHALVNIARLQPGEKVLIHSAAGSTGQMAVKIAQDIGAEIFVTVGTEEKRKLVTDPHGLNLPSSRVFYSRSSSFKKGVLRITNGYGVDVVLNSLSGDGLLASFTCLAPYGRFVDIEKSDIMANASLPMAGFAKNITFASLDLYHIVMTDNKLTRQLVESVLAVVTNKNIGPPAPLHVYPVSKVEQAFRYMQGGKNTGRILVKLGQDDIVPTSIMQKGSWYFSANATYVVGGGLGGLGRAIVLWMFDKGARNFILPSRSGPSSKAASILISELTSRGASIFSPQCDISSEQDFKNMLRDSAHLPPIKGCINSAVDLQDAVFENMTYSQWSKTIASKVHSSWNLHQFLPRDMDFFILLSSLVGIHGFASQANYAAGNTFQDSLARMRTASGFKASVALDLGWVHDIGMVVEVDRIRRHRENTRDMKQVRSVDLMALLDHFCDPALTPEITPNDSQLLAGVVTPADFRARGVEPFAWLARPLYAGFDVFRKDAATGIGKSGLGAAKEDHVHLFKQAQKPENRWAVAAEALRQKLARTLGVESTDIDPDRSLAAYGIDSLMAVELRNWLGKDFRATVTVFEIMGATKLDDVVELVTERTQI